VPELPEVETVVRVLRPRLRGRIIREVRIVGKPLRRRWQAAWSRQVRGRKIVDVTRRGKWIILHLDKDGSLLVHLGMTGRLMIAAKKAPLAVHTHVVFRLHDDNRELRFHDPRRFGSLSWHSTSELTQFLNGERLGTEPWDLTSAEFARQLRCTRRCLKAILLDQRVVAGVGNIYADEALFEAQLLPRLLGCRTTLEQADRLRLAIVTVLRRAIDKNGSTIRNFFYGEDEAGSYQNEFRVYQQTEKPCPRCRTPIKQIRLAGRATHYCPKCQGRSGQ
jgi:formamidopyrimidine-DNA glycosylase